MDNRIFSFLVSIVMFAFLGIILLGRNEADILWHRIVGGLVLTLCVYLILITGSLKRGWKKEDENLNELKRNKKDK